MTYADLKALAYRFYRPILILEDFFPFEKRHAWGARLTLATVVLFVAATVAFVFSLAAETTALPMMGSTFAALAPKLYGLFLLVLSARFAFTMLEAFHNSYYFDGLEHVIAEAFTKDAPSVSFEVASIVHYTTEDDVTAGLLMNPYGIDTFYRLGIDDDALRRLLADPARVRIPARDLLIERDRGGVTLPVYVRSVFKQDASLSQWLFSRGIIKEEVVGAAEWIMRTNRRQRQKERWYSRDNLSRIDSITTDIVYGERFTLSRFGTEIEKTSVYQGAIDRSFEEEGDVEAIEAELARARQANVILVGKDATAKLGILAQLAHKIRESAVLAPLSHKHVFLFDVTSLLAASPEKAMFESTFIKALNEANHAGNIILVLDEFPAVIAGAHEIGSDVVNLLQPYITSSSLQIIATSNEDDLHRTLERDGRIKQAFEVVRIHDVDEAALVRILEQRAVREERRAGVILTYPALRAVGNDARRYFPDAVMPDKAFDLLEETVLYAHTHGVEFILPEHVSAVVEGKTGIPLGDVDEVESDKLQHLEEEMQQRVIGQSEALSAIAGAVRRARAGINDPDRPIGTFLFLGPTGVGKTETAKALAHVFFGDEHAMHRLDMSEFQGQTALGLLIGKSDGTPGRLSVMLREYPYRVLLLDEFEKADPSVHDLFLQILDEGEFTDEEGMPVNARNTIIIATSNAGADLIFKAVQNGDDITTQTDEIINEVISSGTFRPELINRFDAVILFKPLVTDEAREIARLALEHLRERLQGKGLDLSITDALLDYVAKEGYDVRFGGRNVNRFIKEHVEQIIADKIIAGEVERGQTIELSSADIATQRS